MPTEVDDIDIEDVEEALLRAEELATITGRKKTDIVADLLDDGKLNLSAGSDTEVKKDILDIAQEKAEKFKTLITTLIPVLALLLGVGAEGLGVLDVTGWGSDSMWEGDPNDPNNNQIYWGCTNYDAANYDPVATDDDGSCYWDNNLDPQGCDAYLINAQSYILEADAEKDAVRISADVDLVEEEDNCDSEQFQITWRLYQDNQVKYEHQTYEDGAVSDPDGADYTFHTWDNVEAGTYESKILLMLNGELLDEQWTGNTLTVQSPQVWGCIDSEATNYNADATDDDGSCEYPPTEPCEVEIQNHYRGHEANDAEQDAIVVAFKVVPENCEDETIFIELDLFQNGYAANYTWETMVSGNVDSDISHIFDGVAVGNSWIPMITVTHNGSQLEQVNFGGIDVVAPEPEVCEINLYEIYLYTNATHAVVNYDLDCGTETNQLEGYNVSVQFIIYQVGEGQSDGPVIWDTTMCYIQGYTGDMKTLTLTNFSDNNTTHYDIYWFAIWTDADDQQQYIERKWLNREMNA